MKEVYKMTIDYILFIAITYSHSKCGFFNLARLTCLLKKTITTVPPTRIKRSIT